MSFFARMAGAAVSEEIPAIALPDHPDSRVYYDGLVSGGDLIDANTAGRDAQTANLVQIAGHVGDNAIQLNGSNASCLAPTAARIPTGDFTVCGWANADAVPPASTGYVFTQGTDFWTAAVGRISLYYTSVASEMRFALGGGTSFTLAVTVSTGWLFWLVEHSGTTYTLEVNESLTDSAVSATNPYQGPLIIGGRGNNWPAITNGLDGDMMPFRIFNRILTAQEKSDLYNGGTGR